LAGNQEWFFFFGPRWPVAFDGGNVVEVSSKATVEVNELAASVMDRSDSIRCSFLVERKLAAGRNSSFFLRFFVSSMGTQCRESTCAAMLC